MLFSFLHQLLNLAIYVAIFFFLTFFLHILIIRVIRNNKELNLVLSNVLSFFISYLILKLMSIHLYFLILNFAVFIIYIEFFSLISRGFTISLVTNIKKKKFKLKELEKFYANNNTLKWMLKKRMKDLIKLNLIKDKNFIFLTKFGLILYFLIKFLNFTFSIKKNG